ncbi:uncharacterized protein LOC114289545 [Camellia sinensis]|uniref:uncharacterized protein LOC114289545 n=1 Tax=Camellia sinensis TaxID=4442 RepID=UPI0010358C00|nr:uncharacterized protein LOC114289545 [Camellia sinensis]
MIYTKEIRPWTHMMEVPLLHGFGPAANRLLEAYKTLLKLWVYAYFPRLAPVPVTETPLVVPFSRRFDGRCTQRPRETFSFFRHFFDTITPAEITWQPWAPLPAVARDRFAGADETSRFRILLEGPVCRAWYLGERFLRQTLRLPEQIVPVHPPEDMRETERLTKEQMADYTIGWKATRFRGIGDYREYVQTYLMRPLSGGRRAEGVRPVAPAARTGVGAGAGASRRARVRGRGRVQGGRGTGWPVLPTSLTFRGQGGATYQENGCCTDLQKNPSWLFHELLLVGSTL